MKILEFQTRNFCILRHKVVTVLSIFWFLKFKLDVDFNRVVQEGRKDFRTNDKKIHSKR